MPNTVLTYPIPLYQNLPIEAQYYLPSVFIITAISLGLNTTVTTSVNHNYVIGQSVRLLIPSKYGSRALNEILGLVVSIPNPSQVLLNISSQNVDPFIASPTFLPFQQQTLPQIVAVGDYNSGQINNSGSVNQITFIPGSFIDVSPL